MLARDNRTVKDHAWRSERAGRGQGSAPVLGVDGDPIDGAVPGVVGFVLGPLDLPVPQAIGVVDAGRSSTTTW